MLAQLLPLVAALVLASPPSEPKLLPATAADVLAAVKASGAKVAVVNVWATWCIPCRAELPELVRLYRDYKDRGVALVLVSADFASDTAPAKEFLVEQGVDFPTYLKAEKDQSFIDAVDRDWSGALPATFVYDAKGTRRHSFLGPITYAALEAEIAPLLDRNH